MRSALAMTVLIVLMGGCGPGVYDHRNDASPHTAADIDRKIAAGEPCALLFEARNRLDPKSPDIPAINVRFREIGCYMNTSTRTK